MLHHILYFYANIYVYYDIYFSIDSCVTQWCINYNGDKKRKNKKKDVVKNTQLKERITRLRHSYYLPFKSTAIFIEVMP